MRQNVLVHLPTLIARTTRHLSSNNLVTLCTTQAHPPGVQTKYVEHMCGSVIIMFYQLRASQAASEAAAAARVETLAVRLATA